MADLIISEGGEFYARCECGKQLGMTKLDQIRVLEAFHVTVHGKAWERHVMTDCPIGPYDPEADDS